MQTSQFRFIPPIVALFIVLMTTTASAEMFTTANHPLSSSMSFNVYLGNPNENPGQAPLGTVGPGELTGMVEVDLNVDETGNGTVQFLGSVIVSEDLTGTFDLGPLGTLDYIYEDVVFSWATAEYDVIDGEYTAPLDTDVMLRWTSGTIIVGNATGPLADFIGTGTIVDYDYALRPYLARWIEDPPDYFHGTADSGPGGLVDAAELSLIIPESAHPFQEVEGIGVFYLGYEASVYVATPEPATLSLASIGAVAVISCAVRRRRN